MLSRSRGVPEIRGTSLPKIGQWTARLGAAIASATDSAFGAVASLFHCAGASALFESSTFQRCFRDASGSHQQLMASNVADDRRGEHLLAGACEHYGPCVAR